MASERVHRGSVLSNSTSFSGEASHLSKVAELATFSWLLACSARAVWRLQRSGASIPLVYRPSRSAPFDNYQRAYLLPAVKQVMGDVTLQATAPSISRAVCLPCRMAAFYTLSRCKSESHLKSPTVSLWRSKDFQSA
ncbi:uncharacterized protein LOC119375117 [Rhipicephalus sanguineus]|uniref:uncharacterized protein LOC119375117 n=1 Tax=Rhipicephalus sanguineus TaxID=34632 RepID=UPI0020C56E86|nr:uncharacterized protein LOC119375117 [Rhipicephalus sanguineus]